MTNRLKLYKLIPAFIIIIAFIILYLAVSSSWTNTKLYSKVLTAGEDMKEVFTMFMVGCLCAVGSALSCYIPLSDNKEAGATALIGRVATGFLIGAFGGIGFLEYAGTKGNFGLSVIGLTGIMALFISLLGVPIIQTIYRLGKKWLDNQDVQKQENH